MGDDAARYISSAEQVIKLVRLDGALPPLSGEGQKLLA